MTTRTEAHQAWLLARLLAGAINGIDLAELDPDYAAVAGAVLARMQDRIGAFGEACAALGGRGEAIERVVIRSAPGGPDPDLSGGGAGIGGPAPGDLIPPLSTAARLDPELGKDACPWLDRYISFSRKWSPRSFDGFHETIGLWVLSTVAARRVVCHFGGERFTNLYMLLAGRTTMHAKSSAAAIGKDCLRACGLDCLLAADQATPAAFIKGLASRHLPSHFDEFDQVSKARAQLKLGFAGQRGWYYEEFGSGLASMLRTDGIMADFRSLLRLLDDCPPTFEKQSIARGEEVIESPYLALLAVLTPADLAPLARKGAAIWGDGLLARFALIAPTEGEIRRGVYPKGDRVIPQELVKPLVAWHTRLGVPDVEIGQVPDGGAYVNTARVGPLPQAVIGISDQVFEAIYRYYDALIDLCVDSDYPDLDGNLGRFHIKALRCALLFASLEGSATLELRHWARGQEIAERWREYTYRCYFSVAGASENAEQEKESKVFRVVRRLGRATAREIGQRIWGMGSEEAGLIADRLAGEGLFDVEDDRTRRYLLAQQE